MTSTGHNAPGGDKSRALIIAGVVGVLVLVIALFTWVVRTNNGDSDGSASSPPKSSPSSTVSDSPSKSASLGPDGKKTPGDGSHGGKPGKQGDGANGTGVANNQPSIRLAISKTATPKPGVSVDVTKVESIRSRAETPGETSRPSLRITVRVRNTGDKSVSIGNALANLYYGPERTPANTTQRPGGRSFPAKVSPGGAATGVFIFNVPPGQRDKVFLEVSVDATIRRVEFAGDCSNTC